MIEEVTVCNFQSLHDVSLKLGRYSVIVGPSSSGKSAFTRALRTLTSNQRGDSFISHGQTQCMIKAKTERGTVALLRGKKNEYVIIPETGEQRAYTKLSGTTPEEVSQFIGIASRDPLNYSNQFDMPYLLTASAAEVARTLGDLTNVSVIFEASREANRRRLQANSTLKTRAADHQQLTKNLEKFSTLAARRHQLGKIEEQHAELASLAKKILQLDVLLAAAATEIPESSGNVEDLQVQQQQAEEQHTKLSRLDTLLQQHTTSVQHLESLSAALARLEEATVLAEDDYATALREAGTCPLCGQDTTHVH